MSGTALSSLLWLALSLWRGAEGGCAEAARCCRGRDPTCVSSGWTASRVYGTCFCDEACTLTGDCCHDYSQACPARPCIVSEWSQWNGCTDLCKPSVRTRTRTIQQEPQNGGESCPSLEEKAGCLQYVTYQGRDCGQSYVPAFITTAEYDRERKKRALSPDWETHIEDTGYCVEFQIESLSHYCMVENRPYARWMQYLREGYTVCVACQHVAMNIANHRCSGDGLDSDGDRILHWQAVGNPRCHGTWKKVKQVEQCSCPPVHKFIFT
uniref:Somatomedin-B and thrombospondin type-1 domain-containing protein n=1 Tax=Geotrypetes seraphini TaxID=260995 RepID=A0A6P8PP78_GEOSA|nr:somatomedin-B and thrombospondin type-1 domain-containing protein [Geotrypetes seraphini]